MEFTDYVPQGLLSVTGSVTWNTTGPGVASINDPDPFGLGTLVQDAEEIGGWWSSFLETVVENASTNTAASGRLWTRRAARTASAKCRKLKSRRSVSSAPHGATRAARLKSITKNLSNCK
eukprot:COSAG01_NODE_7327_length_3250_cov_3.910505_3_plen_120_part_00